MNILEIEAEGLPRYVGPFSFRFQAEDWATKHVRNGSWSVITATPPRELEVTGVAGTVSTSLSDTWAAINAAQNGSHLTEAEKAMGVDGK